MDQWTITFTEFAAFEKVRESGEVNMFDPIAVARKSGLSIHDAKEIIKHYSILKEDYDRHIRSKSK